MSKKFAGLIFLLSLLLPSVVWSQGKSSTIRSMHASQTTGAWGPATTTDTDGIVA